VQSDLLLSLPIWIAASVRSNPCATPQSVRPCAETLTDSAILYKLPLLFQDTRGSVQESVANGGPYLGVRMRTPLFDADAKPTYSLVVPAHNEEDVIAELAARLRQVMDSLDGSAEAILIDDGSRDRTYDLMLDAAQSDPRFRLVRLSRNFGHQIALTAGLDVAAGDAVIVLDADLQDPPEVVLELAERWRQGYDVVYGVRDERDGETRFKRATAALFYRAFNRISELKVPPDVGDFRLVDRRALEVFLQMRENSRFVRGMFSWIGFRQTGVLYRRHERLAGETKYPLRKMLRFATTGVISFSAAPLRAALTLGFLASFASFLVGVSAAFVKLTGAFSVPGWASIIVVMTFIGGVQLILLGVIGEYIGDIHAEVKRRPLYVVSELENFADGLDLPPRAVLAERRARLHARG
jgi:glycosyltransferase involved in cell wall biosynthesis